MKLKHRTPVTNRLFDVACNKIDIADWRSAEIPEQEPNDCGVFVPRTAFVVYDDRKLLLLILVARDSKGTFYSSTHFDMRTKGSGSFPALSDKPCKTLNAALLEGCAELKRYGNNESGRIKKAISNHVGEAEGILRERIYRQMSIFDIPGV